ncbi:MAG: aldehyde dehydrogenase family protein [Acidobacteriota bacterium]
MTETFQNFIGGEWRPARDGETAENINPADTRDVIGRFAASGAADVDEAFAAAEGAFDAWAGTPAPKRGEFLFAAAELLSQRAGEIGAEMTREEGKTLAEARGEVARAAQILRYFGGEAARLTGETVPSERPGVLAFTFRRPLGPVALITPWNFPIAIPAWKLGPALASGNTVVLKPASPTPLTAVRLAQALEDAGLPAGVFNLITGPASRSGRAILDDERLHAVSFTGSCATGERLREHCARRALRSQLEMGGKNPAIVLRDANIEEAVGIVVGAAFASTGQKCTATSRVIVEKPILGAFTEALVERTRRLRVGPGLEEGVDMGPCVDESQMKTVLDYIEVGKQEGARLLCGGRRLTDGERRHGFFVEPAVFDRVTSDMVIARQEIFGPVLAVMEAADLDEALRLANDVSFGLSASLITRDLGAALRYIRRIEAGLIMVNLPSAGVEYQLPFGGLKASSSGQREQGSVAVDFFTDLCTVYMRA